MLKKKMQAVDVAIVGGGMVGLSLALMLARQDICKRIVIFDERSFDSKELKHYQPSFDGRSTAVSAGSARLLDQAGVWKRVAEKAQPIHSVNVSDKNWPGFSQYDVDQNNGQPLGYVVDNRWLGMVLKDAVHTYGSIEVHAPAVVKKMQPSVGGTSLLVSTGAGDDTQYFACLTVLADGAASPLATSLGITFSRHDYEQHALITNVVHSESHNGSAYEHFTEQGPLAFLPLTDTSDGKHRSAVVWTHADKNIDAVLNASDASFLDKLQMQFGWRLGKIESAGQRQAYSLNLFFADEQVRRGIALVGNAAHFLHPVAGQGFNLALRDCAELVVQLKLGHQNEQSLGDLSLLQTYIDKRKTDQWLTTELSHNFISLFTSSSVMKRAVRSSSLSFMNKTPPLKSLFFNQMMGQGLHGVNIR